MKDIDVLLVGTPNIDIIVGAYQRMPGPGEEVRVDAIKMTGGGGPMITSVALARLGLAPAVLCSLGDDFPARYLIAELRREGVLVHNIPSHRATGISVALEVHKDRKFITYDGSTVGPRPGAVDDALLGRARHAHLTSYRGAQDLEEFCGFVDRAHALGTTVSLDSSWDDTGRWDPCVLELARRLDIFFSNQTEICHYLKEDDVETALARLGEMGVNAVVKLGGRGSAGVMGGQCERAASRAVAQVDTTGAGDAFDAGFLFGFLRGDPLMDCLRLGNRCGALAVSGYGGYPEMLNLEELRKSELCQIMESR